jgi:hypothetical protein
VHRRIGAADPARVAQDLSLRTTRGRTTGQRNPTDWRTLKGKPKDRPCIINPASICMRAFASAEFVPRHQKAKTNRLRLAGFSTLPSTPSHRCPLRCPDLEVFARTSGDPRSSTDRWPRSRSFFGSSSTAFGRLESSPVRNHVRASSFAKAPQTPLYRDICLS